MWVTGAAGWPRRAGFCSPSDPAASALCALPSQNLHCTASPANHFPTVCLVCRSRQPSAHPHPLLVHVAAVGTLVPGRLPFLSDQTAVSSRGDMRIPLRREPPKSIKPNCHPQNVLNRRQCWKELWTTCSSCVPSPSHSLPPKSLLGPLPAPLRGQAQPSTWCCPGVLSSGPVVVVEPGLPQAVSQLLLGCETMKRGLPPEYAPHRHFCLPLGFVVAP